MNTSITATTATSDRRHGTRRRVLFVSLAVVGASLSVGAVATAWNARQGATVSPATKPASALTCDQLIRSGPGASFNLSPSALEAWSRQWSAAHC